VTAGVAVWSAGKFVPGALGVTGASATQSPCAVVVQLLSGTFDFTAKLAQ
jgi:hypothetical protein